MKINRAYKVELNPTNKQRSLLKQHGGAARFVYNWGLARRIKEYKELGTSGNAMKQHKELNALKKSEFPWMYDLSKCAPQEALRDLDRAYSNFFKNVKQGKNPGFPKFKSKHKGQDSFRLTGSIRIHNRSVNLPRLGEIRLKEAGYIPLEGIKILNAACSERANRWFVSIQVEQEIPDPVIESNEVVGIDLGSKTLAVCSNGVSFENPKAYRKAEKQLKKAQKNVSRKEKGSNNRKKAKKRLARVHFRVSNIRKDSINRATTFVVKTKPRMIVLEDLSVGNMLKNHCLAKTVSDASWSEFRRQIEYKAKWAGIEVCIAPRFFPSSQLCSTCGFKNTELTLRDRDWMCPMCGSHHDRDINASINLKQYGIKSSTESFSGIYACGDSISPISHNDCRQDRRSRNHNCLNLSDSLSLVSLGRL